VTPGAEERRSPGWPSGRSRVVGVIGDPIRHSLSPLLHNAAFDAMGLDWVSVAFEVPAGAGPAALAGMRALGIAGLSVTMPHKEDAARTVDRCSPDAERLGAVNCVTLEGGELVGDSTDGPGFLDALASGPGFDPGGHRCVVVGAGGAARAVILALAGAGAAEVVVLNRDGARAAAAAGLAGERGRVGSPADLAGGELVVQATPVGMAGVGSDGPHGVHPLVDPAVLHRDQLVVDIVYHPARTPLLVRAEAAGARTANGLGMLVHQAAHAVRRWTGQDVPVSAMWETANRALADRQP